LMLCSCRARSHQRTSFIYAHAYVACEDQAFISKQSSVYAKGGVLYAS